jgi:hypothetical protein
MRRTLAVGCELPVSGTPMRSVLVKAPMNLRRCIGIVPGEYVSSRRISRRLTLEALQ